MGMEGSRSSTAKFNIWRPRIVFLQFLHLKIIDTAITVVFNEWINCKKSDGKDNYIFFFSTVKIVTI